MDSKLLSVSKIMCDKELIELIQKKKDLEFELFWKQYNLEKLHEAMAIGNKNGPNCNCVSCYCGGRFEGNDYDVRECEFEMWFENILKRIGMKKRVRGLGMQIVGKHACLTGDVNANGNYYVIDENESHFVFTRGYLLWNYFTYGGKIWKASDVCDPELVKLKELFRELLKKKKETKLFDVCFEYMKKQERHHHFEFFSRRFPEEAFFYYEKNGQVCGKFRIMNCQRGIFVNMYLSEDDEGEFEILESLRSFQRLFNDYLKRFLNVDDE